MSSRILADLESGAVTLIHELEQPPTDGSQLPPEALGPVASLALKLGLEVEKLTPTSLGWLFDIATTAAESVAEHVEGHAQAGAPAAQPEPAAAPQTAVEAPVAAETEVSAPAAPGEHVVTDAVAPDINHGAPAPDEGAHPATPVTEAKPGMVICPTCQGFRTEVKPNGDVVTCPTCNGHGEVPAGTQVA